MVGRPDRELQEWALRGMPALRLESQAKEPARPQDGQIAYADGSNWNPSGTGAGIYWYGLGSWYRLATGAGIPLVDGDKGDVVVSATGLTWTIDNDAVTFAKMQNIASDKLLGRVTAGSGNVEEVGIADFAAASSVALTDKVLLSQSGAHKSATVEQIADAVYSDDWTDLTITGTAVNPPGAASDPTLNANTGLYEFSESADNVIIFAWQLPHGWSGQFDATKAVVVPHMHVRFLTSTSAPNNVSRWKIEYDVADANGTFTNAYASWTSGGTVSVDNPADTTKCAIIDLGDIDLAGYGASTILHVKVSRLAGSDAADTDTSKAALYSADLHYQVRRAGTDTEIPT